MKRRPRLSFRQEKGIDAARPSEQIDGAIMFATCPRCNNVTAWEYGQPRPNECASCQLVWEKPDITRPNCSHPGAGGPCMPRVADGRCIWCERLLPEGKSEYAKGRTPNE